MNQHPTGDNFKKNTNYAFSIYSQNVRVENDVTIYPRLYLININNFNEYDTKEAIQYFDFKDQNDILEDAEGCKSIHLVLANIIDTRYNKGVSDKLIRYANFLHAKSIEELISISEGDEEFMEAQEKVEKLMRDKEFIGLYDKEEADRVEKKAMERYGEKKGHKRGMEEGIVLGRIEGREEGLEQGREEGQNQERKIMIKRMAANHFSIPQIANLYQISSNEVQNYLQN